jgi:hypothetical protein
LLTDRHITKFEKIARVVDRKDLSVHLSACSRESEGDFWFLEGAFLRVSPTNIDVFPMWNSKFEDSISKFRRDGEKVAFGRRVARGLWSLCWHPVQMRQDVEEVVVVGMFIDGVAKNSCVLLKYLEIRQKIEFITWGALLLHLLIHQMHEASR